MELILITNILQVCSAVIAFQLQRGFHCSAFIKLARCLDFLILECLVFIGCFVSSNIMISTHFMRFPVLFLIPHDTFSSFLKLSLSRSPSLDFLEGRPAKVNHRSTALKGRVMHTNNTS